MLSRSRRSRRSNSNNSSSSSRRSGGRGRGSGGRHNRQSSATTSTHHGHNNGIAVSGRDQYISRTEQNQILLAQRLGLIQHLPLVQWESKKKPAVPSSPGPKNQDENTTQQQRQQPPSGSQNSGDHREIIQSSTSINNNSPPGYEKTEIYLPQESAAVLPTDEAVETVSEPKNESNNRGASDSSESNDQECTICMEEFENGENIRYLPCMHYYHQTCIDNWLMRSFTCPRCMESVDVAIMNSFAQQLS